jgi:hypothetical protein
MHMSFSGSCFCRNLSPPDLVDFTALQERPLIPTDLHECSPRLAMALSVLLASVVDVASLNTAFEWHESCLRSHLIAQMKTPNKAGAVRKERRKNG